MNHCPNCSGELHQFAERDHYRCFRCGTQHSGQQIMRWTRPGWRATFINEDSPLPTPTDVPDIPDEIREMAEQQLEMAREHAQEVDRRAMGFTTIMFDEMEAGFEDMRREAERPQLYNDDTTALEMNGLRTVVEAGTALPHHITEPV